MLRVLDPNIERLPGTARPDLPEAGPGAFGDQFGGALLAMALLQGMRTRAPGASALERARVSGRSRPVFRERVVPPRIA